MKILKSFFLIVLAVASGWTVSCDKNSDFVIFSIEDDKILGEQVANEIAHDPENFNLISREEFPGAYEYIDAMLAEILASEEITYRNDFKWEVTLIHDQDVWNAFAAPGGKLYIYTGLIYFLEKEDDLAGVMGHEVAHVDQRHSSIQLQRQYGISALLSILTGDKQGTLEEIVDQIAGTGDGPAFSRRAEAEADDFSVRYLSSTPYACNSAAAFFEKLLENKERNPGFLNIHPSPDNRVEDINAIADKISCDTAVAGESATRYRDFWTLLP